MRPCATGAPNSLGASRRVAPAQRDHLGGAPRCPSQPLPPFQPRLRHEEWQALERRDVGRAAGVLTFARTVSSGDVVPRGKTPNSLRQVPLAQRALDALGALPPRLDTPVLFRHREAG